MNIRMFLYNYFHIYWNIHFKYYTFHNLSRKIFVAIFTKLFSQRKSNAFIEIAYKTFEIKD